MSIKVVNFTYTSNAKTSINKITCYLTHQRRNFPKELSLVYDFVNGDFKGNNYCNTSKFIIICPSRRDEARNRTYFNLLKERENESMFQTETKSRFNSRVSSLSDDTTQNCEKIKEHVKKIFQSAKNQITKNKQEEERYYLEKYNFVEQLKLNSVSYPSASQLLLLINLIFTLNCIRLLNVT